MTNEELRRKSGRDMEFNRQQSGRDMEFNRQQSGRNMEESRRASGRKMRDDMNALAERNRKERALPSLPSRGGQPAKRGSASWSGGTSSGGGGGGISSPLKEENFFEREYYPGVYLTGDFLTAVEINPLKKIIMKDADGAAVVLEFDYRA